MFVIANRLYGVNIYERSHINVWHTDACFFNIFNECHRWLGCFYLDVCFRDHKSSGAWMDRFVSMMLGIYGSKQCPIAYLVCNSHAVCDYESCFLSHDEVSTLFCEFGHVLHHIMAVIDIPDISGINGVVLDANGGS